MSEKTISEYLFEQFCDSNDIPYQRIATRSIEGYKTPDYDVFLGSQTVVTEVKQIDHNKEEQQYLQELRTRSGDSYEWYGDSASRIRNKISDAMPQLKKRTKNKLPSLLVLYNNTSISRHLTDSFTILTAMYGREALILAFPKDSEPILTDIKFGGNRKVSRKYNTSLSAVAVMDKSEKSTIQLNIYHNIYARMKFNPNWLRIQSVNHFSIRESTRFHDWIEV